MDEDSRNTRSPTGYLPVLAGLLLIIGLTGAGGELLTFSESAGAFAGLLGLLTLVTNAGVVVVCAASLMLCVRGRS